MFDENMLSNRSVSTTNPTTTTVPTATACDLVCANIYKQSCSF